MSTLFEVPAADVIVNDSKVLPEGQLMVDFTNYNVRVHDGVTPGGHRTPNAEVPQQ